MPRDTGTEKFFDHTISDMLNSKYVKLDKASAMAKGQTAYWAKKPCPYGHVGWAYCSDDSCVICVKRDKKSEQYLRKVTKKGYDPNKQAEFRRKAEIKKELLKENSDRELGW